MESPMKRSQGAGQGGGAHDLGSPVRAKTHDAVSRDLCKGTLLVARPTTGSGGSRTGGRAGASGGGSASGSGGNTSAGASEDWQPFRFTHHNSGAITLHALVKGKSKGGSGGKRCLFDRAAPTGGSAPTGAKEGVEYLLDADWQKPFVACPWRPLPYGDTPSNQTSLSGLSGEAAEVVAAAVAKARGSPIGATSGSKSTSELLPSGRQKPSTATERDTGGQLYPFTLSYAPLPAVPGEPEPTAPLRRTVVLAARDVAARDKWLATLAQKAHCPDLRRNSVSMPSLPGAAALAAATQRGRLAALGERHSGLTAHASAANDAKPRRKRLPAGHQGLWEGCSRFHVVRELYDGYASDPLGEVERGGKRSSSSSKAASMKKILEHYVERQATIESMLGERTGTGRLDLQPTDSVVSPTSTVAPTTETETTVEIVTPKVSKKVEPFQAIALTPNVKFDGRVLANDDWSGGALLRPPNCRSFRLTIRPEEAMDMNPVFIGIAPADADLSMVNFFDVGGGIFLCMGGIASEALIAALGAPGGPFFHCFGERTVAELPVGGRGACLSVQYTEETPPGGSSPEGQVIFLLHDVTGDGIFYARPRITRRLTPGRWRPCVLLSMPNTHVHIESLTTAPKMSI
eukprot:TRINITY_DN74894_c0_g1_i1.p1 TRINITY_DN74894_c0_g1~~TRINITY_DN74894_c0_g1_i1.p1  ORF type:complete len:639 (+),score=99.08 TRINITY_DN74894_c0_g1_i1:26-1918(+)